ncbi:tetratricopeptide repeat protein 1 isoform X1 [Vigna radiata var. radiata]|uniref:Tetratricopeptide repeat protein 1 isoform X1 n=1 Tax=Vigna radiata var. radiata TaxID=3916 RepID=A0A1S3TWW3_VIGRR|nr:tetratricopeptide repeat protein 1 isoform X1 [Vigna radiata var. radiata]XP_022635315.1 tetratricopeptide repeat protein 1 isoform X1 [Vigna radiata var. radiata]
MVVIEQEESEHRNASRSNAAGAANDASDGFETASEADLASDDDGGDGGPDRQQEQNHPEEHHRQQQTEQLPEHDVPQSPAESSENALITEESPENSLINEEESRQKALDQANEAKLEGNKLFVDGKYEEALSQYEVALQVAPDTPSSVEIRSICHSNRGVCFLKLGKYDNTIKECTKALELNPVYVKAFVRRGEAHEKLEHFEEAIADMKKILEIDPSNDQARKSIRRLEPLAAEKREKMKEEMIAKLKDMGNSVLGRFGMSVDNFKAVKDPNTGSYSISFQR